MNSFDSGKLYTLSHHPWCKAHRWRPGDLDGGEMAAVNFGWETVVETSNEITSQAGYHSLRN